MPPENTAPDLRTCPGCDGRFPYEALIPWVRRRPTTRKLCRTCFAEARNRANRQAVSRRREAGTCIRCARPRLPTASRCLIHWAVSIGANHGLTTQAHARRLVALLEAQDYRCALTGERLTPGVNASLDRIVPRREGGDMDSTNLQWVTRRINIAKADMSTAEFVAMCEAVVAHGQRSR